MEDQLHNMKNKSPTSAKPALQFTTPHENKYLSKNESQQSVYISNNADADDEVVVKGRMSHAEFVDMLETYRNSTKGLHQGKMNSSRPTIKVERVGKSESRKVVVNATG